MSKSRAKGTAFETAIVGYVAEQTGWAARRLALHGARDHGDIHVHAADVVISAKNAQRMELAAWVDEARAMAGNAGTRRWCLWMHRRGKASPADGYVVMSGDAFLELLREAVS